MLGIIGGTGLYEIEDLEITQEHNVITPFSKPSDLQIEGLLSGQKVIFLPRHGRNHRILPSEVNYRANIWALKKLGVTKIISISATGSLRKEIKAGDLVIPNQYFDHTHGTREQSFFGNGLIAHVSTAHPTCEVLTGDIITAAKKLGIPIHTNKTYACVQGPRLGTKAESHFLRQINCDLVGMTNVPEAFLAREAQISYATICIATDYDCWLDDPSQHAAVENILSIYQENIEKVKSLLKQLLTEELSPSPTIIRESLKGAIMTDEKLHNDEQKAMLKVLLT